MSDALADHDLSPETAALLARGAADALGYCCMPGQVVKNWAAIREAEKLGYLRFLGEHPWITDAGRAAIGAPSQMEADRARVMEAFGRRKPALVPSKKDDPRTDFDYRSYRAMGWVCTLVMKQPDAREKPNTIRVGKTLHSDPQFLGPNNSIVLEVDGRFLLVLMPPWLIKRAGFSTYPLALDPDDVGFTETDRVVWDRMRRTCQSVNSRIRTSGRRVRETYRFGESA